MTLAHTVDQKAIGDEWKRGRGGGTYVIKYKIKEGFNKMGGIIKEEISA